MSKTLLDGQRRVFAYIGVNPDKQAEGQYGREEVTVAINTAQRFVVKAAIPKSLGALVRRTVHSVPADNPTRFTKSGAGNGRTLFVALGTGMTDNIPLLAYDQWMEKARVQQFSQTDLKSYWAMEAGAQIYVRPAFTTQTAVTEFFVDDPRDMVNGADLYSLPDDWFEWVNMNAAALLLMAGNDPNKMVSLTNLMTGWSAQFRAQWGMNPPSILAPAATGKVE